MMREIELLAPAKNLECGKAAIDHGADAVYIGAPSFGARAAAGNSVDDIAELCRYAHRYGAKVYVTVNTIVYDNELDDVRHLLSELQKACVDAVLIQDMGLLSVASACQLVVHASTQTDNRTTEKVKWLRDMGFRRVVLARELSVEEIDAIHRAVPEVELEVFVHGALCVSYSGVCYASQYCFGRSANRGACAQFCRLRFNLEDADGRVVERGRHLLSLKDLCQIDRLEELMNAGAVSFKIEGRLKDVSYVKNVTSAYSRRLNEIIARNPEKYRRASWGRVDYTFTPNLKKTFNRGFTHYFLDGRQPDIFSPDTPKAIGECVGKVKELRGNSFNVAGTASFANGDGLCFINEEHELEGFRVNRADGNRLYPLKMPHSLKPGTVLYRNHDVEFERLMCGKTAERKIPVSMKLTETADGFALRVYANDSQMTATVRVALEKLLAEKPPLENIVRQLTKLGGTCYDCKQVDVVPEDFRFFIPSSILADLRRQAIAELDRSVSLSAKRETWPMETKSESASRPDEIQAGTEYARYPYLYNIANHLAREFYEKQGLEPLAPAFETGGQVREPLIMQCRHCLKYSLGYCTKRRAHSSEAVVGDNSGADRRGSLLGRAPWREPLFLTLPDGRRFRLEFNCKACQMNVYGS